MSWKRVLVLAALTSLSATGALAILVLLFGRSGEAAARILGTTVAIALYSLLALPGTLLMERRLSRPLAFATVALAAVGLVSALVAIWAFEGSELRWKIGGTLTAAGIAATQAAALVLGRRRGETAWVRRVRAGPVATGVLLAVLATLAIWNEIEAQDFYRVVAALAVLDVLLLVLQPLVRRLGAPTPRDGETRIVVQPGSADMDAAIADAVERLERAGARVRVER